MKKYLGKISKKYINKVYMHIFGVGVHAQTWPLLTLSVKGHFSEDTELLIYTYLCKTSTLLLYHTVKVCLCWISQTCHSFHALKYWLGPIWTQPTLHRTVLTFDLHFSRQLYLASTLLTDATGRGGMKNPAQKTRSSCSLVRTSERLCRDWLLGLSVTVMERIGVE